MDRVKEALFNILQGDVIEFRDGGILFGGTGAVRIEAFRVAARTSCASDLNRAPVETIAKNLAVCKFTQQAEVRRGDAFAMLSAQPDKQFEYIYIAPPQYKGMWLHALKLVEREHGLVDRRRHGHHCHRPDRV